MHGLCEDKDHKCPVIVLSTVFNGWFKNEMKYQSEMFSFKNQTSVHDDRLALIKNDLKTDNSF